MDISERIAQRIWDDITGRSGFDLTLLDDGLQCEIELEIVSEWKAIIDDELTKACGVRMPATPSHTKMVWETYRQDVDSEPPEGGGWFPFAAWKDGPVRWYTEVIMWRREVPASTEEA